MAELLLGAASTLAGPTSEQISKTINSSRNVTIQLSNNSSYILTNPRVFCSSGYNANPPPPTIKPGRRDTCAFSKSFGIYGVEGVLTYDIADGRNVIAMMFSVPNDINLYKVSFAVAMIDKTVTCDQALFKTLEKQKTPTTGSMIMHSGETVEIKATMSPAGCSIMKVDVSDILEELKTK